MPPATRCQPNRANTTARKAAAKRTRAKHARKTRAQNAARKARANRPPKRRGTPHELALDARKAIHAKGARTRAVHQTERRCARARRSRETAGVVGDYAERAVLIPVGAALIARDRVVSTVSDTLSTYSSSSKAQAQLRRFERRGVTARNRLEREVRKARVRVERELRQRRRVIENRVSDLDDRREALAKNSSELANRVPELAREVQERILSLV